MCIIISIYSDFRRDHRLSWENNNFIVYIHSNKF